MSEWISVKDKLPKIGDLVIGYFLYGPIPYVEQVSYIQRKNMIGEIIKEWHDSDGGTPLDVTHWMPLPEPPNENE